MNFLKKWWKRNIADYFPWGDDCVFCNKVDCDPKYCRSKGLIVDK